MSEHKGTRPSEQSGKGVFLSPRVIDQGAFEEYGSRLRELVEELGAGAESLAGAIEKATQARGELESTAKEDRARIDGARDLLSTLDARTRRLEEAIERSEKLESLSTTFERDAARIVGGQISELDKRVAQSTGAFARQLKGHLDAHTKEAEGLLHRTRNAREQIAQQTDHVAQRALTSLRETCDKAEYLAGRKRETDGRAATGSLAHMVERAEAGLASIEQAETRAKEMGRALEKAVSELDAQLQTVRREREAQHVMLSEAAALVNETRKRLGKATSQGEMREQSLATHIERGETTAATLTTQTDQAIATREGLDQAHDRAMLDAERLTEALDRLEPWRQVLLDGRRTRNLPQPIADLIRQMRGEMASDLRELAQAMGRVAAGAESFPPTGTIVEPKLGASNVIEVSPLACGAD